MGDDCCPPKRGPVQNKPPVDRKPFASGVQSSGAGMPEYLLDSGTKTALSSIVSQIDAALHNPNLQSTTPAVRQQAEQSVVAVVLSFLTELDKVPESNSGAIETDLIG